MNTIMKDFLAPLVWIWRIIKMPSRFYTMAITVQRLQTNADLINTALQTNEKNQVAVFNEQQNELAFLRQEVMILQAELAGQRSKETSVSKTAESSGDYHVSPQSPKGHFSFNYYAFENHFRGSREFIKGLQKAYLPWLESAFQKTKADYVLDLGCGRGEFLELLAENNIPGVGVDITSDNVLSCQKMGFQAHLADALSYLRSLDNNSLIGVVAMQVVEHLEFNYLYEMIMLAYAKIRKGGCIILETPNPYSFFSLRSFYIDPSHQKPIPPVTLEFLVKNAGFEDSQFHYYCPVDEEQKLQGDDKNTGKLNELLFNFQGYAVIARK